MEGRTPQIGPKQPPATKPPPSTSTQTLLSDFPADATMTPFWRPEGDGLITQDKPIHIGILPSEDPVLILSIKRLEHFDEVEQLLQRACELETPALLMIGHTDRAYISAPVYGAGELCTHHGIESLAGKRTVFLPSETLRRILGIKLNSGPRVRNGITLVNGGRIVAQWIDQNPDGDTEHDWANILTALARIRGN